MRLHIFLLLLLLPSIASAQQAQDKNFTDFINDATDGSWFDQAILVSNKCDFSKCRTKKCIYQVFNETVFEQECEYVSSQYGIMGRDWDVLGQDAVAADNFSNQRYFDDLGIEIFATSEKKVLHFDITSSVNALNDFVYNLGRY